jgi:23S rRNA (cytosine1962-C5)-methyltransferase
MNAKSPSDSHASPALPYPTVELRPDRVKSLGQGHPWIFSGALAAKPAIADSSPVIVRCKGETLGTGLYHGQTDIAVRMVSRHAETLDQAFFMRRFAALKATKENWLPPETDAYRLAFGEGDNLPGLIVDVYGDVLVLQAQTAAMAHLKPAIVPALQSLYQPRAIVERSDVRSRQVESGKIDREKSGKEESGTSENNKNENRPAAMAGLIAGELPPEVIFREYGLRFIADVLQGQKTGFFLDQRENRQALRRWVKGRRMLNTFCYSGGFSVACARDAQSIVNVDISKRALEIAQRNYALNGLPVDPSHFQAVDAFEYLKGMNGEAHDAILLDPPAFAKNRGQLKSAIKAYISLNTLALRKLPPGGILATSSCTAHVDALTFIKILHQSAVEAHCTIKVLDSREQPFDHPYHLAFPEGRYLKFFVLQKADIL